jgi:hypothetical protein
VNWTEIFTYILLAGFVIVFLYVAYYTGGFNKDAGLEEGEIVEGENEVKEKILEGVENIEDDLKEIGAVFDNE